MTTPSQTVGPYFSIGLDPVDGIEGVRVAGTVSDGAGEPVPDAVIETWDGSVFARAHTDDDGRYEVVTPEAPYVDVSVFGRGMLQRVVTRIHFAEQDIPAVVPQERRGTLLAQPDGDGYRFDIRLQGPGETVFFSV
jgi:protocatechuate 3,4-dioxygenase, alpha subunit